METPTQKDIKEERKTCVKPGQQGKGGKLDGGATIDWHCHTRGKWQRKEKGVWYSWKALKRQSRDDCMKDSQVICNFSLINSTWTCTIDL